jgi:Cu/Ag efflux pump CusA
MLHPRFRTALLVTLALLIAGGIGGYLIFRDRLPTSPEQRTEEPAPKPPHDNQESARPARSADPVVMAVLAAFPGASPEEVERQVTIPLEVGLSGMPRLQGIRSKSAFGLCSIHARFEPGTDYAAARQEVINRLGTLNQALPTGVIPLIAPETDRVALRYVLRSPKDPLGRDYYTLNDLRALQDGVVEREFRTVPGVIDVEACGGTFKRYEIRLDPDRLRRYGVTLAQIETAITNSELNVGGDFVGQGEVALTVRKVGLFGGDQDALRKVLGLKSPAEAVAKLRSEEQRRLRDIRELVITSVNNQPVRIEDVVEGGRVLAGEKLGERGVIVSHAPRLGQVGMSWRQDREAQAVWDDDCDLVQGVVLLRPGEELRCVAKVQARIQELNTTAGKLLPGVQIEPYWLNPQDADRGFWIYGTFPLNVPRTQLVDTAQTVRQLLREKAGVDRVLSEVGGPDYGDEGQPLHELQFFVDLRPGSEAAKARSRKELIVEIEQELTVKFPGAVWQATTEWPEDRGPGFPGAPGRDLLKIVGPDLVELEALSGPVQAALDTVRGVRHVVVSHCRGPAHLEFRIDVDKCRKWGVKPADVAALLQMAQKGKVLSPRGEGEKSCDIFLRGPWQPGAGEASLLDMPIDILNNIVAPPGANEEPGIRNVAPPVGNQPRLRLRDLVTPVGDDGEPDPKGQFLRPGTSAIYREDGHRLLLVRFTVAGRPRAEARAEAAKKIEPLLKAPYRLEWGD